MDNWITHIDDFFADVSFDEVKTKQTDLFTFRTYRKNGTYISIDLNQKERKISKIECGKYWVSENKGWDFETSNIKAVLNKKSKNYLEFLQTSYFGEEGAEFELELTENDKAIFKKFMDIPLNLGWTEFLYSYKNESYKSVITLKTKKITKEITLMHFVEQDLPMIGDKFGRMVNKWWSDLGFNEKNRSFEMEIIKPIKPTKA